MKTVPVEASRTVAHDLVLLINNEIGTIVNGHHLAVIEVALTTELATNLITIAGENANTVCISYFGMKLFFQRIN